MEPPQANVFEHLSVPKSLAQFIIPSVVSQLAMLILNLTDAFFVGRTGDTYQISAMTITFPVAMMMSCVASIFGAGGNANVASALGAKDLQRARRFSVFALYAASAVVALFSLVLLPVEEPLLLLLGADEHSLGFCRGYLLWVLHVPCVPLVFSQVIAQLFTAEGETKIASMGIAGAGLINAALDPLFIFGFELGVVGAGIATCIANYCSCLFFLLMLRRRRKTTVLSLHPRYFTVRGGICPRTLVIGVPAGLTPLLMNSCDFVRNYLLGAYGGQVEIAAWGTVQKLGLAFMTISLGISQGVRPLVAYNYTAGAIRRTKAMVGGGFLCMGTYTVICFALVMAFPALLVRLFLPVDAAAELAASFLRVWIPSMFGIGVIEMLNAVFQAIGRWKIAMANVVVSKLCLLIPIMLLLVRPLGVIGVVASQPIAEAIVAAALIVVYLRVMGREPQGN